MSEVVVHRRPSPKTLPPPPATCALPWKKMHRADVGTPLAVSTTVSFERSAVPAPARRAPSGFDEFGQPWPTSPMLAHGQAVPLVSPKQNGTIGPPAKPS